MSKFELGDKAYYWYLSSTILSLECMCIQSDLQVDSYSFKKGYYKTKKEALDAMYRRLQDIEIGTND